MAKNTNANDEILKLTLTFNFTLQNYKILSKIMREYVVSLRQFRLSELRHHLPHPSSPSVDNERQETRKNDKMFVVTENKQKSAFRTVVFVVCCVALVMDILFSLLTILKTLK